MVSLADNSRYQGSGVKFEILSRSSSSVFHNGIISVKIFLMSRPLRIMYAGAWYHVMN